MHIHIASVKHHILRRINVYTRNAELLAFCDAVKISTCVSLYVCVFLNVFFLGEAKASYKSLRRMYIQAWHNIYNSNSQCHKSRSPRKAHCISIQSGGMHMIVMERLSVWESDGLKCFVILLTPLCICVCWMRGKPFASGASRLFRCRAEIRVIGACLVVVITWTCCQFMYI